MIIIDNPITLRSPKATATKWIPKDTPRRKDKETGEFVSRVVKTDDAGREMSRVMKGIAQVLVMTSKARSDTLILRPKEFKQIRESCDRRHQIILDSLLYTGMRYTELLRLRKHPEWLNGQFIHLPSEEGQKKVKRAAAERWVRLSIQGRKAVESLFDIQLPSNNSINQYFKYNFRIPAFSLKSLRKTYESWLVYYYPNRQLEIAMSQGHTMVIQVRFYLNLPFTDRDKVEMTEFVEGWV
jgi:integrase